MDFKKAQVITEDTVKAKAVALNDGQYQDCACEDPAHKDLTHGLCAAGDCACQNNDCACEFYGQCDCQCDCACEVFADCACAQVY